MLKIRLQRTGKKNQPFFRIVVTDKNNPPRGGRAVEILGFFNPKTKEKKINSERAKYWLSVGAQASDRVHNMLVGEGIIKAEKKPVHAKPKKKEEAETTEQKETPKPEEKPEEKLTEEKKQEALAEKKEEPKEEPNPVEEKKEEEPKKEEEKEEPKKEEKKEEGTEEPKPEQETK